MKYLQFVFEHAETANVINKHEDLLNFASSVLINYNMQLENYIYNNLELFIAEDLASSYNGVRNFIIQENLDFYNLVSRLLINEAVSDDEKAELISKYVDGVKYKMGSVVDNKQNPLHYLWNGMQQLPSAAYRLAHHDLPAAAAKFSNHVSDTVNNIGGPFVHHLSPALNSNIDSLLTQ